MWWTWTSQYAYSANKAYCNTKSKWYEYWSTWSTNSTQSIMTKPLNPTLSMPILNLNPNLNLNKTKHHTKTQSLLNFSHTWQPGWSPSKLWTSWNWNHSTLSGLRHIHARLEIRMSNWNKLCTIRQSPVTMSLIRIKRWSITGRFNLNQILGLIKWIWGLRGRRR